MRAGILGAGVIGCGWAARFLLHGWDVIIYDADTEASDRVIETVNRARRSLEELYDSALPMEGQLSFTDSSGEAVQDADWVQESVPESLALKRELYQAIHGGVAPGTPVASSTSGFKPTDLARDLACAGQMLVCHPFNPVYLLPVVEVVAGERTRAQVMDKARETLSEVGMKPVTVRREIDAHIADRLLEALWREALWLVADDVATTQEIDDVMRYGFGLRWAQMGLFETYRIAGGEAGMRHFLEQFGPALEWPWSRLTDVPELDDALIQKIAAQSDAQSGQASIAELEQQRDENLVAIIRALKGTNGGIGSGVGEHINQLDVRLKNVVSD